MSRILLLAALVTTLLFTSPSPLSARSIFLPEDQKLFEFVILPAGTYTIEGDTTETRELVESELEGLRAGAQYWANMLEGIAQNDASLRIMLYGITDANAFADSPTDPSTGLTALSRALIEGTITQTSLGNYLAYIAIGSGMTYSQDNRLWALPRNGQDVALSSVGTHELMHALGLIVSFDGNVFADSLSFPSYRQVFAEHMYDVFGTQGKPGMAIKVLPGDDVPSETPDKDTFYLVVSQGTGGSRTGVYFSGQHVREVLNGARLSFPEDYWFAFGDRYEGTVPGLPLNGFEGGDLGQLCHVELQNSLMSHQGWRNWGILMEAELALLQDLGYPIDRRDYFGWSIYNSGTAEKPYVFVNTNPYYDRADGDWLAGTPSDTAWGIGLHVYGSWTDVTQAADILTVGYDATGIRLEGVGNVLTVREGTSVRSDGQYGTGLLVSYGKEHVVNVAGTVTALGEGGIAARFDFGDNILGNSYEFRGSYIWTSEGSPVLDIYGESMLLSKIDGELVTSFNVSGTLMGSHAAIYIAENAYVENINILSGAWLWGDIVSDWNPGNELLPNTLKNELYTTLTFGNTLSEDGTLVADQNFSLGYDGSIDGAMSIDMKLDGGALALRGGTVDVRSLEMADGTTLLLWGLDTSAPQVTTTDYVAIGDNTTLSTSFTADGKVTGIQAGGEATIGENATWFFSPLPDFYASGAQIVLDSPITATGGVTGSFATHLLLGSASPTLSFLQLSASEGADQDVVGVTRAENAYSRYAKNETSKNVGNALVKISENASGDMQNLLAALDWSSVDGSGVAKGLAQLGPDAYDAVARATLAEQNEFNLLVLRRMLARFARVQQTAGHSANPEDAAPAADSQRAKKASDWEIWATPYGGGAFQGTHGGLSSWKSTGVGLLLGADRHFDSGLSMGGHVALAARRTHVDDGQDARADTKSAFVGLQAFFAPESWDGVYLTGQGRIGIESGDMEREIHIGSYIGSYHRSIESRWSGFAGSVMLGGGKDFTVLMEDSSATFGPLAWFEYAFLNRPAFSEKDGQAARLRLDQSVYDSLLMNIGAHAGWQTTLDNGTVFGFDILAAWRHELLDGNFATSASFAGYGSHGFDSESELAGRDSMLLQVGIRLAGTSGFSANLEAGVELFREDFTAVNVGLNLAWEF